MACAMEDSRESRNIDYFDISYSELCGLKVGNSFLYFSIS